MNENLIIVIQKLIIKCEVLSVKEVSKHTRFVYYRGITHRPHTRSTRSMAVVPIF